MELVGDNTVDGNQYLSTQNSIAAAGTTQGTATILLLDINNVTTVAAGTGVILPALTAGAKITIFNNGANTLLIYPAVGDSIDILAANAAISVPVGSEWTGAMVSSTNWQTLASIILGTANQISVTYGSGSSTLGFASNPVIPGTGSLTLPSGTTAQRPGSPVAGMLRFNSTTGQYEAYDTAWGSIPMILDKSTTSVAVATTTVTSILSYSVPANTLGTSGIIKVKVGGAFQWTAAKAATFVITFGTFSWTGTTSNTTAIASTVGWTIEFNVIANNSASAQTYSGVVTFGAGVAANATGTMTNITLSPFAVGSIVGTSAQATTSALTLGITMANTVANGTITKYYHTVEIL